MRRLRKRLNRRLRQATSRTSRSALGIQIPNQSTITPKTPIKLRKFAKAPTTSSEPTLNQEPVDVPDPNPEPQIPDQNQADQNLEDNLEEVYTKIESAPNYSAKIAEFLRKIKFTAHIDVLSRKLFHDVILLYISRFKY